MINYAGLTPQGNPLARDMMSNIQEGIKAGYLPRNLKENLQEKQLANALQKIALQYAPQNAQADLAYNQQRAPHLNAQTGLIDQQAQYYGPNIQSEMALRDAQTRLGNAQADLPFGGQQLPGAAGQLLGLESIKRMFGENSEQYNLAKRQFDLGQRNTESRIGYQDALTDSMPMRYLTQTGKGIVEQANVGQGNAPSGLSWENQINPPPQGQLPLSDSEIQKLKILHGVSGNNQTLTQPPTQTPRQELVQNRLAPASAQELFNQYGLKRLKETTDEDTRKRARFATNVEKTLDNIDIKSLMQYGAINGKLMFKADQMAASLKHPPERYQKFLAALDKAHYAADQVTQFYGSSIQPEMLKQKLARLNPAAYDVDPDTAEKVFRSNADLLRKELATYRDALSTPDAYKSQDNQQQNTSNNKYSQEDIEHTAKLRGISVAEVKSKLGIK